MSRMVGIDLASLVILTDWHPALPVMRYWLQPAPQHLVRLIPVRAAYVSRQYHQTAGSLVPLSYILHHLPHDLGPRHAPGSLSMQPLYVFILRRSFQSGDADQYLYTTRSVLCKCSPPMTNDGVSHAEYLPAIFEYSLFLYRVKRDPTKSIHSTSFHLLHY